MPWNTRALPETAEDCSADMGFWAKRERIPGKYNIELRLRQTMDLSSLMGMMGGGRARGPAVDEAIPDTAETIHISSLALLKMLKHGARRSRLAGALLWWRFSGVPWALLVLLRQHFDTCCSFECVDRVYCGISWVSCA